jgi:hypothetical protein
LSNTGAVSAIELEIAPSTSPDAFCCSSASFVSLNRRTFSIAIAAWSAKVRLSAICLSLNGLTSARRRNMVPNGLPSRSSGTESIVWRPNFCARAQLSG